jgi:nitrogen fixation/metabolism regulation signal transduction histidine kinase
VKAFLALPYFARQGEVDRERAASYAAMVNLFALLFLMSVLAAALITNWTTRPLQLLRRGLERIGLGTRNEPIPYHGNDELGQLVEVYNRKVEELRVSAEKLARSERESAWREMARQVAHEIKNPLTPMKLNIQHFQRTWTPNLPDAKERLDRLSAGLVDQIDALSHIADEFTHFAQMPPARPVDLDLGEAARRAVALYSQQPGATVELVGDETLTVHIDPDHLLRILNNLIKNALQAISPERDGRVRIILERTDDEAVMEVRDNGEGISEEWRERIFTPNFTTKSSGMGLGLSMVQRMAEHAGGRVWFETTTGVGTSFFVALPSQRSPDTFAASDQPVS